MVIALLKRIMTTEAKKIPIPSRGVDYRGKVVLAPMVRSGELPSRLLALRYGADLVWGMACIWLLVRRSLTPTGPETIDRAMIGTTRRFNHETRTLEWTRPSGQHKHSPAESKDSVIYRMCPEREKDKLIFQIGTSDPDRAVQAARLVAADVAGIDVNAGCPKPFSTSGGMGAALLRTPDTLVAILEALVKDITPEHNIGISVKIRILEDPVETEALVRRLVATGITGLTLHCRTPAMRKYQRVIRDQLRMVVDICHEAGVACLMNGDVADREQGLALASEFGADGAMVALAAETNPSCFRTADEGGILPWREVVEEYLKLAMGIDNRFGNTKFLLGQMVPGKEKVYRPSIQARSYAALCKALEMDHLIDLASATDASVGLDAEVVEKLSKKQKNKSNASAKAAGGDMRREKDTASRQRGPGTDHNAAPAAVSELASAMLSG